jgi:hypothetical protein
LLRHGRACPGHPRLDLLHPNSWMPGTSPGMTRESGAAQDFSPAFTASPRGGMARRKAQSGSSCSLAGARGRLSTRHIRSRMSERHLRRSHSGTGPRFSPACRAKSAGRAFSQLLAGTPSGPGRSSDAARVNMLRARTRGRRTSSRFEIASRNAPSEDEVSAV